MIRAYGLHWSRNYVYWGTQGPGGAGRMQGYEKDKKKNLIDFRYQIGVYALYYDFNLVYVGQTRSKKNPLFKRLKDHKSDHLAERWNRFSWFGTRWVTKQNELSIGAMVSSLKTTKALNVLEAVAIAIAEPRLNLRRGNWGNNAVQYFQINSNKAGGPAQREPKRSEHETDRRGRPALKETGGAFDRPPPAADP